LQILITNDDGVHADGLWALAKELKEIGKVTVAAPDRDQSGSGTAVTLRQPLRLKEVKAPIGGIQAYSVEGTPGDSVILAIRHAIKDKIDLVVSGINEGPNLGNDVFISGTIGAALQGYFYGIPAIAISVAAFTGLKFELAARIARKLAEGFQNKHLPQKLLLNVNVPNLETERIEGIEITRLGDRSFTDRIDQGHDGKRDYYWITRGVPEWSVVPGTDVWALEQNRISVTSFPDHENLNGYNKQFFKDIEIELLGKH
jgi:5'-nucleotidase